MAITIGSGLGGFTAIAAQGTYGGNFVTPTRAVPFKANKPTINPHPIQGGPYLRDGQVVDIGSAHKLIYTDATGTLEGDMMNTGQALLVATAFGSSATLTQHGTTTAYELGGATGFSIEAPDPHSGVSGAGCCFDMQIGVPQVSNAELRAQNYHSVMITKAEWVFDRMGPVTYSYDWDAQRYETETAIITPSEPGAPELFTMTSGGSVFKAGALNSEVTIEACRKCTLTVEHKLETNRVYLGEEYKSLPITNGLIEITAAIEVDYTAAGRELYTKWLTNTPESFIMICEGAEIGTSGKKSLFELHVTNGYIETGATPSLDGPDLVKNTLNYKATVNAAGTSALKGALITPDSTF